MDAAPERPAPEPPTAEEKTSAPEQEPKERKTTPNTSAVTAPPRAKAKTEGGLASEFTIWGQMILDGKSGTVPNIWKLKLIRDLEKFRIAWEKYKEAVKTYNMTHALQIKEHPLISCVDPEL